MTLKEEVYKYYLHLVLDKIATMQQVLDDLRESGANETKSTAGDKHETALAMIQIEQANKRAQLDELFLQRAVLDKINPAIIAPHIVTGSLIKSNRGYLYLSVALGKASVRGFNVTALSPHSPLGSRLLGLKVNDSVEINNNRFEIEGIE